MSAEQSKSEDTQLGGDEVAGLRDVLADHPNGPIDLVSVRPISTGASNKMFRIETDAGPMVLRMPPQQRISSRANDMSREWRLLCALERTDIPHARPILQGDENSPLGSPFLLMEYVQGFNLRWDTPRPPAEVRDLAFATVGVLADISAVPWDGIGLSDFGKPDGFLERQVDRWTGQLDSYRVRHLEGLEELTGWLADNRPSGNRVGLMHGDFTFMNVMASEDRTVAAVVDWEQATIGDPMMDLGWWIGLWAEADEQPAAVAPGGHWVTQLPGMPTRAEIVARYGELTGCDVSAVDYYQALALFKLAVVLEGHYARWSSGKSRNPHHGDFEWLVPQLVGTALDAAHGKR
ncbi:phosphotransferase family protein [Nocardia sp. NPDC052278]|uniref:phosphotransferase family protein n=1 Tax=unclassified Nocardia TaxID=2637762 RepID=UPI0036B624B8